jgi:hypothetical protein
LKVQPIALVLFKQSTISIAKARAGSLKHAFTYHVALPTAQVQKKT